MTVQSHRQDRRGPRSADGDHHRARELTRTSRATRTSRGGSRSPRGSPTIRRARWRRKARRSIWIDGGLHATEVLGAQQLIETIYQFVSKNDEETHAHPARRHHPRRARQSGRHGARVRLVHAQARSEAAQHRRAPAPLPEVRRARQQPRLLHDEPAGIHEHEPDSVSRVVPADHVQPSPDRPGRHGDVLAAVPRSVQLRLRSARRQHARSGRRRDAQRASTPRASPA